jgi:hypothetical protein
MPPAGLPGGRQILPIDRDNLFRKAEGCDHDTINFRPMNIKKLELLKTPFERAYENLKNFLEKDSVLPDNIKQFILNQEFFKKNPPYYLYYPHLFCNVSPENANFLERLSIAGFLLYQSTLINDNIFDKSALNAWDFRVAGTLQEEAMRILFNLFGDDPVFWKKWEVRKEEYYEGFKLDKSLTTLNSFEDYVRLCDLKSSIGKVAIDCICHKMGQTEAYTSLYVSHNYFYVAFQILDDIADVEEDLTAGQFNMAYYELGKDLANRGIDISEIGMSELKKYLHVTGVSNQLRRTALGYLSQAEKIALELNLPLWASEIQRLNNTIIAHIANTEGYIKYISRPKTGKKANPNGTKEKAIRFIETSQLSDGSWNDFFNSSGVSDTWATAFVLYFLSQQKVGPNIPKHSLSKATSFLAGLNGNWGYHKQWIRDCDSTNFTLLALLSNDADGLDQHIFNWVGLQLMSGAFSTFTDYDLLVSSLNQKDLLGVKGWMVEHACVSSVAFLLLCRLNRYQKEKQKLYEWLLRQRDEKGLFNAYWWTSPLYSTAFILKGLLVDRREGSAWLIDEIVAALLREQDHDGSFGDSFVKQSPFYTGLILDALCESDRLVKQHSEAIARGVKWLRDNQQDDGGWEPSYAMRMPHPENLQPNDTPQWPVATMGTQIRADDYSRMFSTTVCLSAICKYGTGN